MISIFSRYTARSTGYRRTVTWLSPDNAIQPLNRSRFAGQRTETWGTWMQAHHYALIIIDMQNDMVLPGAPACVAGAFKTIPRIRTLLDVFRLHHLPIFHIVREYRDDGSDIEISRLDSFLNKKRYAIPGTAGAEIVEELKPLPGEYRIIKQRFSAFMNTELDFMLRRIGATHLVICGTQYPNCVRTTIYDAISYGYHVINITDATSAQTPEIAEANILDIRNIGTSCITSDEFIRTVCQT